MKCECPGNMSAITDEVAGDLDQRDRDKIDAAWEKHQAAMAVEGRPDWPPQISAIGLAKGEQRHGSTGQLFEARDGRWVRVTLDHVDRTSHSYLLGVAEYHRDKFKAALEQIVAYEISDNLNYYNARRMIEIARDALS